MRALISLLLIFSFAASNAENHADTLKRVAETGEFRIGYVPDAPPLSFLDGENNVVGYSIDLCRRIASAVRDELGLEKIEIVFTPLVSMDDRLRAVENGDIDIECGSTTVTLSRRERVDYTLMTFITGSAVLSRKSEPIDGIDDLDGAKIAVLPLTFVLLREVTTATIWRIPSDVNFSAEASERSQRTNLVGLWA